ncbi:S41 family peptidase [Flavobacterium humi]|uniref:Peptidase S41 n=1 Tax=Flavobacterium humi TaxID=2562683 RepID=A0A4Z0LD11_9FLAO|nr:S41 family peptidase [Flavobacterium humi]TGD59768.1 peptidase S41 [Flavobacterium humi]
MRKILILCITALFLIRCASVEKHNAHIQDMIPVEDIKSDIDFAYGKMQKMHPDLYWYISKKQLDYKFDSLKATVIRPMTSLDFYKKLSPVISTVGQGHLILLPNQKKYTKKEVKAIAKKGIDPITQFEFEIFNDKLYIVKNKSNHKKIQTGTEVLLMNNQSPQAFMKEYDNWFASDGFNKTFKKNRIAKSLKMFYTFEHGLTDSIVYHLKFNDSIRTVCIKRDTVSSGKKTKIALSKEAKRALNLKKFVQGYDKDSKTYMRNLRFMEKDSSVAVLTIKGFKNGDYSTFYKEAFEKIKKHKSQSLIIDLRNNGGGRMSEIANLYAYLADTSFVFTQDYKVTSKTSLFRAEYFKSGGIGAKVAKGIASPIYYGFMFFKVRKGEDGLYYYHTSRSKIKEPKQNAFSGKIYVLINGGSFSASSIISSDLKGSKRAYFVGEETGGAYNGSVAGFMPLVTLPKSKLKARIGLMSVRPYYQSATEGRGIFPDKEIVPALEDRIKGTDPEMDWIINDIKSGS